MFFCYLCLANTYLLKQRDETSLQADIRQERINTPSDHYNRWEYRIAQTIEELMVADQYNRKIKTMITRSKR